MKHLRSFAVAAAAALASPAAAQSVDLDQAKRDLDAIFARQPGQRVDTQAALAAFVEFFDKYPEQHLGPLGYAVALQAYFARDYDSATAALDRFFEDHRGIDDPEHRRMAGRVYLAALSSALRAEPLDHDVVLRRATWALQLYDDKQQVLRLVAAAVKDGRLREPAVIRTPLARLLAQGNSSDAELDAELATLYSTGVEMTALGPIPKEKRMREALGALGYLKAQEPPPAELAPFRQKAMSGKTVDLADYRGKVVLVDFWATWCGPCLAEMPNVVRVYEQYHDQGLEIIGVSLDEPDAAEKIAAAEKKLGMKWEQIHEGGAELARQSGVGAIPFTFLLDRKGVVRHRKLRGEALQKAVAELIDEK